MYERYDNFYIKQSLLPLQRICLPFRTGQMYYMFGFVTLAFVVLLVVCGETSILLCYFHLCTEDYRWWWRSFFSTGTTSVYLFLFSLHYFFYKTTIVGSLSYLVYFAYTFIIVFLFFIIAGKLWVELDIVTTPIIMKALYLNYFIF